MEALQSPWLWWPALILAAALLAWFAAGAWWWLLAGVPLVTAFTVLADVSPAAKVLTWILLLGGLSALGLPPLRRRLISLRAYRRLRLNLPLLTETEREALEAGDTGWEAELFRGRPVWRRLRKIPHSRLSEAEHAFLEGPVETFCAMVRDHRLNVQDRDLPGEAWAYLREQRFFGLVVPEEFGGCGFSPAAHAAVVTKIASRSVSAALTVAIPNAFGPATLILQHGTEEQKRDWLPRLARGEELPCLALTGPEAGSDVAAIPDHGVVCRADHDGQPGVLGIRLSFDKRYVSLAPVATVIAVAFKLRDPDGLLGEEGATGITVALVPADAPGVEIGARHDPMHMGFHNGPVRGRDVFVPMESVIGGVSGTGRGWRMLLECRADNRAISLPALASATAKMACRTAGAYARVRYQFHNPIANFEGVQEALATIAGNCFAMKATRQLLLAELDQGRRPIVASALVKYSLTERCRTVVDRAMDIHAGAGVMLGPSNLIGEIHKFPALGVAEGGANILTRSLATFGQGVVRCHPCLRAEAEACARPGPRGLKDFDRALGLHLRLAVRHGLRAWVLGLTRALPAGAPARSGGMRRHYRRVGRVSAAFALTTDVLLVTYGGSLGRRQRMSGRMADVLSQMYIASAALRLYEECRGDDQVRDLAEWVVGDALHRAWQALDGVCRNLPGRWRGRLLGRLLFPWGRPWPPPPDRLERRLAELISVPSSGRDRLTSGIFLPQAADEPLTVLEAAMGKVSMTAALEAKLRQGAEMQLLGEGPFERRLDAAVSAKLLSPAEADELRSAERARRAALVADEYPPARPGEPG